MKIFFPFFLGWILIGISHFFKHTKGLYYLGSLLLIINLTLLIISYKKEIKQFFIQNKFNYLLLIFLIFLLPYILISSYKIASLEAFFLNYFSNVILYFNLYFIILLVVKTFSNDLKNLTKVLHYLFLPIGLINLFTNFYFSFFVLVKFQFNIFSFLVNFQNLVDPSWLKGLVILTPIYTLLLLIALAFSFELKKSSWKYFWGFLAIYNLVFLLLLGRRATLLGLLMGFFLITLLTKNKLVKRVSLGVSMLILLIILVLLPTSLGKSLFIRSENLQKLLSFKYEEYASAGSLGMRFYIWPIYLRKALEDPLAGTGLGRRVQKRALWETNKKALSLEHAHNLFLNLWLQAGLHTSFLFLICCLYSFYIAYKSWRSSGEDILIGSLLLFLIAFFVMSLLEGMEEGTRFTPFWITLGLIWGLYQRIHLIK